MAETPATSAPAASGGTSGASTSSTPPASAAPASQPSPASSSPQQPAPTTPNVSAAAEAALSGKGPKAVAAAYRPSQTPPAATPAPSNPQEGQQAAPADDLGLSAVQIQALKRSHKFDAAKLSAMSPDDRKAYADAWDEIVRENDRQHSLSRQNRGPDGKFAPKENAEPGTAETSAGTPTDQQDGAPSQESAAPQSLNEQALNELVLKAIEPDPEETKTLAYEFGEEGVKAIRQHDVRLTSALTKAVSGYVQQHVNAAQQAALQAAGMVWDSQFEAGIAEQSREPGFETLTSDPEVAAAYRQWIIAEARAGRIDARNPRDAAKKYAGSYFNVDPRMAAQVAMTRTAAPMLATSGARPSSTAASPRPITQADRMRAAMNAALGGQGREAVRQAAEA